MSPEQQAVANSLTAEVVAMIDAELMSHARKQQRKVAMVVGLTMSNPQIRVPGLPDLYYAERVKHLVKIGRLIAEGNLDYMRYSEVRLPS
jgi:hypothetical protein